MEHTIKVLLARFPHLKYKEGSVFCWSPETKQIIYTTKSKEPSPVWSLLHETSHALLEHTGYKTDFELLRLEVAAWEEAKKLASELGLSINEDHIQDCLDTYRDWLYARSICPYCNNKSLQQENLRHYYCFNCHAVWKVTTSRFCRAYRSMQTKGPIQLLKP